MALTYRMHDLGLLTDWQYRSACTELSQRGYRKAEPEGMKKRETSQVLTKVFQGLRSTGMKPAAVAAELGLTPDEMNKMLFGLTMTMVDGAASAFGPVTWAFRVSVQPARKRPLLAEGRTLPRTIPWFRA
ncbi:hypothetical protein ACFWIV_09975 [Streptomyces virginiae]|uniref:hypothetical protein n=1 Tax=Streptomyces virginiae TaxID=1961 RepID=UPI00365D0C9A